MYSRAVSPDGTNKIIDLIISNTKNDKMKELSEDTVKSIWIESTEDSYEFAPEDEYTKWIYDIDENNGIITLTKYNNFMVAEEAIVYANYTINGKIYKTNILGKELFSPAGMSGVQGPISVKFSNKLDTSNVTDISKMFYLCSRITSIDFGNFDTSNVTDMSNLLTLCIRLESINISSFNTSKVTDMSYMFNNCSLLTTLDLRHFDTSNVTDMMNMFYSCTNMEKILVSSNWKTTGRVTNMFRGCGCSDVTYA